MPAAARVLTAAVADWLAGPPPPAVSFPPFPSSFLLPFLLSPALVPVSGLVVWEPHIVVAPGLQTTDSTARQDRSGFPR